MVDAAVADTVADTGVAAGVLLEGGDAEDATSAVGSADMALDMAAITATGTAAGGDMGGGYVLDMYTPIEAL